MKHLFMICLMAGITQANHAQTVQVEAGVNCNCATNYKEAATESWDNYFMEISSPDRVQTIDASLTFGLHAGVSVNWPLTGKWAFQPGIHFNMKGAKAEGTYGSGGSSTPFSQQDILTYIDLVLAFQYWINQQVYLELGPELGFLVARKFKETKGGVDYESSGTEDANTLHLGIGAGAGYMFGNSGFGVFARYTRGLTKFEKAEPYYENVRTNAGQFGVFYRIPRKGKK